MGYRSDVAYMIQFQKKEDYWGFIAEAKCDPETAICFADEGFKQNDALLALQFGADQVKWYPDYAEVKAHMALWDLAREFHEDNECIVGQYIEVGENDDDITKKEFGDLEEDYISLRRQIICDWVDKKVE